MPFNYGPKSYNSLPGLIIMLKEGSLLFSADVSKNHTSKKVALDSPHRGRQGHGQKSNFCC
ncbi:hypothetical protein [Polaribacter cellanae]|uniref:hypothetical protein n=1 Tax=Polaribacter cellanae TaxID=2818493 RepID=UPI00349EE244